MTHPTVTRYFELMDTDNRTDTIAVFASDAVVTDNGHTYRGHEEILGWLRGPASEFTTTSTQLSAQESDTTTTVVILLEGNFPGGRVELTYAFVHEPLGLINSLAISA